MSTLDGDPPSLVEMSDTLVDSSALTLPGEPWSPPINGEVFQQDAIRTFAGRQYVAYYDRQRHVCMARRRLPKGAWDVIRFQDYTQTSNDGHNVVSIGVCPADGTIHVAFDHHVSPLHYRVSLPGVATQPDTAGWSTSRFGAVQSHLAGRDPITVTYPRFWPTPAGGLQFHYRRGGSGSGDDMLADYDPGTGTWSASRQLTSREGTFRDDLGSSPHRNAYPNGYDYDPAGRLHATWVWRESAVEVNHDLCYAYSDDGGRTWCNDLGTQIAGAAGIDTPFLVVQPLGRRQGLMNSQAQAVDGEGRVHVVMWSSSSTTAPVAEGGQPLGPPADRRHHHYWREGPGVWHDDVLPGLPGSRPSLFVDAEDNLVLIYGRIPSGEPLVAGYYAPSDLTAAVASARSRWQDWRQVTLREGPFVNEMLGDRARWRHEGVLSIMVQEKPPAAGEPSALRVLDYLLQA